MPNFTSSPYTPRGNGQMYTHASGNYQALYSTVAYTDPIPLPDSSLDFLPNHAYHNAPQVNAYDQPKLMTLVMRPRRNFSLGRS
jgi:hypothetical protein